MPYYLRKIFATRGGRFEIAHVVVVGVLIKFVKQIDFNFQKAPQVAPVRLLTMSTF